MLARSTACRHGLGRAWTKATSIKQQAVVAHEQVGRLDVAMGQPGVPQGADERQPVVHDPLVDLGVAELDRMIEELGDEQVLPFGGQLHEAVGPRRGQAGEVQLVQCVVLLLDQSPHRVERPLVLQPAVQQLPAELVPAVGPEVAGGVELAEQPRAGLASELDAERRRAGGAGEPERFDVLDRQTELVLERLRIARPRAPPMSRWAVRPRP